MKPRRRKGPLLPRTVSDDEVRYSLLEDPAPASNDAKERSRTTNRQPLYGDIALCILGTGDTLTYLFETYTLLKTSDDESLKKIAITFLALHTWPLFFYFPAAIKRSRWCSRIGFLGVIFMLAYEDIMQYPYPGECTITFKYQAQVMMAVMANTTLSFLEKMIRLGLLFLIGSYVSITSPFSIYVEDTLPFLGGTILIAIFALYVYHFSIAREYATVQAARSILAAIFFYHTVTNTPGIGSSASEQIGSFVKSIALACVGLIATGTFQQEVLKKEQLEILVQKRTKKLHMVSMALQASETAIVITDKSGAIVWLNHAFENLCGVPEIFLIGRLVKDVIYNCDPSRRENKVFILESYEDVSKPRVAELRIGEAIYAHESTPFPEHEGEGDAPKENNRFLMVFKDVTASRAQEVAEQKAHDKAMMAKAMGDSMVTLTHELRTPLQGIMGVASMLMQGNDLGSDAMESMKVIMASSTLLLNLINNLLDVKKATAKMMEEFPLSPVSAAGPIDDAIVFSKPLASISDVEVSSDIALAPNAIVVSNSLRLQQVLINLVSNAIKYTAKGSKITVKTCESTVSNVHAMIDRALASSRDGTAAHDSTSQQAVLVFSVADCGPGIERHQAGRLFQRYAQLDNQSSLGSKNKIGQPSGTGLGLHLCQMFVQRMKGHIWVTNNGGGKKGSTFSFSLPLYSNELPDAVSINMDLTNAITIQGKQKRRRSSLSRLDDSSNHLALSCKDVSLLMEDDMDLVYNQRVLFVDDTLINRKVISRILAKVGFLNVTTVDSGEAAMKELTTKKNYDLVISDLQMPGMSGTELSEAIAEAASANETFRWPVVIGLTADTGLDVAERCQASKMSDVLYKPITIGEVKRYAENVLLSLQPGVWYDGALDEEGLLFRSQSSSLPEKSLPVQ